MFGFGFGFELRLLCFDFVFVLFRLRFIIRFQRSVFKCVDFGLFRISLRLCSASKSEGEKGEGRWFILRSLASGSGKCYYAVLGRQDEAYVFIVAIGDQRSSTERPHTSIRLFCVSPL